MFCLNLKWQKVKEIEYWVKLLENTIRKTMSI